MLFDGEHGTGTGPFVAPPVTAAGQMTASTAIMLPASLLLDRPWELALPGLPVIADSRILSFLT